MQAGLRDQDVRAMLIGLAAGLRTFTPPAGVVIRRGTGNGHPLAQGMVALAGVEYIWDKLPFATSRLDPPALGARLVSGSLCGRIVTGGSWRGAAIGGLAAGLAAPAGYHARRLIGPRLGLPDRGWAVAEDAVAISCAAVAAAPAPA